MNETSKSLNAIKEYLEAIRLDTSGLQNASENTRSAYTSYEGLLLVDLAIEQSNYSDVTKNFFREFLSDSSYALLLTYIGAYKPAKLILRGSIENLLRFALSVKKRDASSIESVFRLFEESKKEYDKHIVVRPRIGILSGLYKDLCKTTHVVHIDYMALRVPFVESFAFSKKKFDANVKHINEVLSTALPFVYALALEWIGRIHHDNGDRLRSLIPRDVKQSLADAS